MYRKHAALVGIVFAALSTLVGCSPDDPPPPSTEPAHSCVAGSELAPPADGMTTVIAGIGSGAGFAELADDDDVEREYGAQGGNHVTLTVRLFVAENESWIYDLSLLSSDDVVYQEASVGATACPGGWVESTNLRLLTHDVPSDSTAKLRVVARRDGSAASATFERTIVIH